MFDSSLETILVHLKHALVGSAGEGQAGESR